MMAAVARARHDVLVDALRAIGLPREAIIAFHVGLGGLIIAGVHRFLRVHGSRLAAGLGALFLATDWSFLFYKKVLGGTEILLQGAALGCLWALWSRRWRTGLVLLCRWPRLRQAWIRLRTAISFSL